MWKYMQLHEAFVIAALKGEKGFRAPESVVAPTAVPSGRPDEQRESPHEKGVVDWAQLKAWHDKQLRFMQHERLIHLLVLLTCSVLLMLSIGWLALQPVPAVFGLAALLLTLVAAYVVHYFRLENGVQRWYHLSNRIDEKVGLVATRYNEEHPIAFL